MTPGLANIKMTVNWFALVNPRRYLKVRLHYNENAEFLRQASWFYESEKIFIRRQMANTNAKTPRFRCNVNEP